MPAAFFTVCVLLFTLLPKVEKELQKWEKMARECPAGKLKELALASLKLKKFHCQGGSVFAAQAPSPLRAPLLRAIIALQTISDYLDNLCDRAGICHVQGFTQLHQAFLDALDPERKSGDYYSLYPYRHDGGYLRRLVQTCRDAVSVLPGYRLVKERVLALAGLYCRLQADKHAAPAERERRLVSWLKPLGAGKGLHWWELAAATGSTLPVFALLALAAGPKTSPEDAEKIVEAYFPWIGGLHILLDYFIDKAEDKEGGDLNFVSYYEGPEEAGRRLQFFLAQSLQRARDLPRAGFHQLVVRGLPAVYLSDPKALAPDILPAAARLLRAAGAGGRRLHFLCRLLRRAGVV